MCFKGGMLVGLLPNKHLLMLPSALKNDMQCIFQETPMPVATSRGHHILRSAKGLPKYWQSTCSRSTSSCSASALSCVSPEQHGEDEGEEDVRPSCDEQVHDALEQDGGAEETGRVIAAQSWPARIWSPERCHILLLHSMNKEQK